MVAEAPGGSESPDPTLLSGHAVPDPPAWETTTAKGSFAFLPAH